MTTAPPRRIVRVIARLNVGGPARHVLVLSQRLAPAFETTLVAGDVQAGENEASAWIREHGVTPVRVPTLGRSVSPLSDVRALRALRRILCETKPDILHTHTSKAGLLGRLAARGSPVGAIVHTFHGHVFDGYFGGVTSALLAFTERFLARRTDVIIAVSEEVAEDLIVRWKIAPREKVRVIPIGVPLGPFLDAQRRRGELRRELSLAANVPIVAWVGRLAAVKDVQLALDVARRVRLVRRDAVLVIAGDGPDRGLAMAAAADSDGAVRYLGHQDDTARIWADADLALLTSRNEGTPVALIEAAAAGVPAVATKVGGVPSVVKDGVTGLLAGSGDAEELAACVLKLLADDSARRAMGSAARDHVRERFSAERLVGDMAALYTSLLARPLGDSAPGRPAARR